jgi:hypothetical protein
MQRDRLSTLRTLAIVTGALGGGILGPAALAEAQETSAQAERTLPEAEETSAAAGKTSVELRFTLMSPSARWSAVDLRSETIATHAERSLYVSPGLGVRVFIKQPHHGLLVDWDYRIDTDMDSINALSKWKTDFSVAHVGYAYRFIKHANEKMVWAFTLHASFSAGGSIDRTVSRFFSGRSAVFGGRVGVNVDYHIERFFMGWAIEYEGLSHVKGAPLGSSHFLMWTLIPIFRIGVDLGPSIQSLEH